jgi:hypothetical protein
MNGIESAPVHRLRARCRPVAIRACSGDADIGLRLGRRRRAHRSAAIGLRSEARSQAYDDTIRTNGMARKFAMPISGLWRHLEYPHFVQW